MFLSNKGTGGHAPSEPFGMRAETYLDMGLSVFPCGKDDGKTPLVKWQHLQDKLASERLIYNWLERFENTNIAIVTGTLSKLTIVDSDNPHVSLHELFERFGETPLVAQTPSGGYHLYYKHNGERCSVSKAQQIDIRGQGGYVVAPPSYNPQTGVVYHFVLGDIFDIPQLPYMKQQKAITTYEKGERNSALFKQLKNDAANINDKQALLEHAEKLNNTMLLSPLCFPEVERVVESVWKYKQQGKLFTTGKQRLAIDIEHIAALRFKHSRAVDMYLDLLACHKGKNTTFAISSKAYAKRCGWSSKTVKEQRDILLHYGLIECVKKGGRFKGDVSLYAFSS